MYKYFDKTRRSNNKLTEKPRRTYHFVNLFTRPVFTILSSRLGS